MRVKPDRALTQRERRFGLRLGESGRNEGKARQGIDTAGLLRYVYYSCMSRNEGKARQGIDTTQIICTYTVLGKVEMRVKPDRALTQDVYVFFSPTRAKVEMRVKPDRALTQVSGKVYRILVIVEMKVKPVRESP